MAHEKLTGPIEDQTWATQLQSHVVTPEASPRIHGYDVEGDLAKHYSFADTMMLCVLGEIPSDSKRRAIEIAMQFLAPMSIAHAPTHAGMLTRLCGATTSASAHFCSVRMRAPSSKHTHRGFLGSERALARPIRLPRTTTRIARRSCDSGMRSPRPASSCEGWILRSPSWRQFSPSSSRAAQRRPDSSSSF